MRMSSASGRIVWIQETPPALGTGRAARRQRRRCSPTSHALPPAPQHALAAVQARLFDLLRVVRRSCYHRDFHGSFSLKAVLPALVPHLGYEDMAITDGQVAAALYQRALANDDLAERQRTFADLRTYCRRDTLATLELRKALGELAHTA